MKVGNVSDLAEVSLKMSLSDSLFWRDKNVLDYFDTAFLFFSTYLRHNDVGLHFIKI
jgi:hypothetical protein